MKLAHFCRFLAKDYNLRSFRTLQCLSRFSGTFEPPNENTTMKFKESEIDEIKSRFCKLEGGGIDLTISQDDIAIITINHVDKKNSFSGKMMVALNDCVRELETRKTKGMILRSKGNMFCSGGYLQTVFELSTHQDGYDMCTLMQDSMFRLRNLPTVSVCLVHGMSLGGGAELLLHTDFRVFTKKAQLSYVQARMGVATGWGGGIRLKQLAGRSKALDLLLTGRKLDANEAKLLGIADVIIDHGTDEQNLQNAVHWLNERIRPYSCDLVHSIKAIVSSNDWSEEKHLFAKTWSGPAQRDALNRNIKHK